MRARASWPSARIAARARSAAAPGARWRVALGLALALLVAGCPRARPPVLTDAGPEPDAPIFVPGDDTDADGLCDMTETILGLSPFSSDTDEDGYSDAIEYATGSDAHMRDSPDPSTVVFLTEAPGARIDASLSYSVNADGQGYVGAFTDVRGLLTDPELSAASYLVGARAVGAVPPENVILVEGESFIGVRNRTLLFYELSFESASVPEGCLRGFAFQYAVKDDSDGRLIGVRRGLLVVAPPGLGPGSGDWCRLRDTCF